MKISNGFVALSVLVIAAGCRSGNTDVASVQMVPPQPAVTVAQQQNSGDSKVLRGSAGGVDYTIEVIPNPRLTATSREGDKPNEVYSSNIIAVYAHPRNGVAGSSTNSMAVPNSGNAVEPEPK